MHRHSLAHKYVCVLSCSLHRWQTEVVLICSMLTHSSHKPFAEWPSSKCALLLICFWLIQWWWSIQSVLRTHTHTFRSTKGLFVLLAGRVCEFGEQGWDYSIISYRGPGESQSSVPAAWSRMAVVMANHNRGRSPNPKVMDSSQRQIHTTRPHTCGKKKKQFT